MNVLKKRFVPFALACILVMALAAPAFATSTAGYSTVIDGQYVAAEIDVTVPTTAQAFINPYALPVNLSKIASDNSTDGNAKPGAEASGSILNQQIVTEPMFISNRSEVDLAVSATVTAKLLDASENDTKGYGTVARQIQFTEDEIDSTETKKMMRAYLQMAVDESLTEASTAGDLVKAFTSWKDDTYNDKTDLLVSVKGDTLSNMVVLNAGTEKPGATDGSLESTAGSIAMFRITGQVASDAAWLKTDSFTINIAFTFRPDPIKVTIGASPKSKTIEASGSSIALTAKLVNPTNEDGSVAAKMVGSWDWQISSTTNVNVAKSGSNDVTYTVTGKGSGVTETVTITATATLDNGRTYSAQYTIDIKIPS